jgi:hypothetical protein
MDRFSSFIVDKQVMTYPSPPKARLNGENYVYIIHTYIHIKYAFIQKVYTKQSSVFCIGICLIKDLMVFEWEQQQQ